LNIKHRPLNICSLGCYLLLDLSDRPVKTIALDVGYTDPYYFSRVFKKSMGLSPEKYREIKKG